MKKIITLLSLSSALLLLSACDGMDRPSPLDTQNANNGMGFNTEGVGADSFNDDSAMLKDRSGNGSLGFNPDAIPPEMIACTIYFGFDQYAVAQGERAKLKPVAEMLKNDPSQKIVLVGRTDWYGTEEYNLLLSDKRGGAVSDYLAGLGASAGAMEVVGRGEATATPDVAKDSPEAKNDRRVDVVKVK